MTKPTPYPFQKQDVLRMEQMGLRGLFGHDMGLGKTVMAMGCLYRNSSALPAVIVCPANVKHMWETEAARFGIRATVADGQTPPNNGSSLMRRSERLVIINYDILPYWIDALRQMKLRTIVLDECQMIGSLQASRTKAAIEVARPLAHAIALSGTPLTNMPAELWPTLNIVRPDLFPSFWQFACDHCEPEFIHGEWQYRGAHNLKELNRKLQDVMIRRRKIDVLKDLPKKMRRVVSVELENRDEYDEAEADFLKWLRATSPARVISAARAERMTRVGYLLRLTARLKLKSVVRKVNHFLRTTDEKLVLFAVHRKVIEVLQQRCHAKSVTIDGGTTGRRRKDAVDQFRYDGKTRLLIGNILSAGKAIDGLQSVCRTAGFVERWWTPGSIIQAEDRLWRIGQFRPVYILHFVASGTIEEKQYEAIKSKQTVIDQTLDGADSDGLDVFGEFMVSIMKERKT